MAVLISLMHGNRSAVEKERGQGRCGPLSAHSQGGPGWLAFFLLLGMPLPAFAHSGPSNVFLAGAIGFVALLLFTPLGLSIYWAKKGGRWLAAGIWLFGLMICVVCVMLNAYLLSLMVAAVMAVYCPWLARRLSKN